jgi:Uma2 family endonuclease
MKAIEVRRWTREEYDRMNAAGMFAAGERIELVDGEILRMTPQGSMHATALRLLEDALRKKLGPGFDIRGQLPLALGPSSEPEPDLAVVPGSPRDYKDAHPGGALLVVEISEATLDYDRHRKGSLYARAGIEDYWIVNLIEHCVEVYRDPGQGGYRTRQVVRAGGRLAPPAAPLVFIAIDDILP